MPKLDPMIQPLNEAAAKQAIRRGMDEDLHYGPDITSIATVADDARAVAEIRSREPGVLAGLDVVAWTLETQTSAFEVERLIDDGAAVNPGDVVARIVAPTRELLTCERTFLNLLGHMSGIASATRDWVGELAGTKARVRDSRKTLPGMRELDKYAVRCGGGVNHRMGLGDEALIKDNHVVAAGSVNAAFLAVKEQYPDVFCEVEVDTFEQFESLLEYEPEMILLDNFTVEEVARAVEVRDERAPELLLEASGGLTIDVAGAYAATGVDFLAVGALTHSAVVLDLGLDFIEQ